MSTKLTPEERAERVREYSRRARLAHPEKIKASVKAAHHKYKQKYRARAKERYDTDPQYRERMKKRAKEWAQNNRQKRRKIALAYFYRYRDKNLAKGRQWRKDNPDKCKTYKHNRRTLERHGIGKHSVGEWQTILKAHGFRCHWCGIKQTKELRLTRDHYQALSRGGSNDARNIVPACLSCNNNKKAQDPIDFARSRGLLL